jgi:hypothetical protein
MSESQPSSNRRPTEIARDAPRPRKTKVRVNTLPDTYDADAPPEPVAIPPVPVLVPVQVSPTIPNEPDPPSLVFDARAARPRRVAAKPRRSASPWFGRILWKVVYAIAGIALFFTGMECGYYRAEKQHEGELSPANRPAAVALATTEKSTAEAKKTPDTKPLVATKPADSPKKIEPSKPVAVKPEPPRPDDPPAALTFVSQIQPLLRSKCLTCHGGQAKKGEFDIRTIDALKEGGEHGPAVVPGNVQDSVLWKYIANDRMPPGKNNKLTAAEKKLIQDWIAAGAK